MGLVLRLLLQGAGLMSEGTMTITETMELLANQGWCVVLKKLPPGFPWIYESGGGEYDGPESRTEGSRDTWCCEAQWMKHDERWRGSQFACKPTAEEALNLVMLMIYADQVWYEAYQQEREQAT